VAAKTANWILKYSLNVVFGLWVIVSYGNLIVRPFGVYDLFSYNFSFLFWFYAIVLPIFYFIVRRFQRPLQRSIADSAILVLWIFLAFLMVRLEGPVFWRIFRSRVDAVGLVKCIEDMKDSPPRSTGLDSNWVSTRLEGKDVPFAFRRLFPKSPVRMDLIWDNGNIVEAEILYGDLRSGLVFMYHSNQEITYSRTGSVELSPNLKVKYPVHDW
jgi:hypothetical protein